MLTKDDRGPKPRGCFFCETTRHPILANKACLRGSYIIRSMDAHLADDNYIYPSTTTIRMGFPFHNSSFIPHTFPLSLYLIDTRPTSRSRLTAPNVRLSTLMERLSPNTK